MRKKKKKKKKKNIFDLLRVYNSCDQGQANDPLAVEKYREN